MKRSLILVTLPICMLTHAQAPLTKVDKYYNEFNYYKVIETIGNNKDKASTKSKRELAISYKLLGDYASAENTYASVVSAPDKTINDVYAYAQILKMNGKYPEAEKQMEAYAALNAADKRAEMFKQNKALMTELLTDKNQFTIKNLDMNSAEQEFGATYFKDKVVFTSTKRSTHAVYRSWNGNRLAFLDLYVGTPDSKGELLATEQLDGFNKKYHEGPASFTKDGTHMFYTSENYRNKSADGKQKLELCEARLINGRYGNRIEKMYFDYNNKDYSNGHPALSADGNTLYFASDMPGGKGGIDIYVCTKNKDGTWNKPVNLGDKINTEGNEMFPFIHENGWFFFSSDGHPGLGGLDVFATEIKDGNIKKVINVGVPVNSSKDDFCFILNETKSAGYFSSNREGGKGNDDIYSFHMFKPFVFGKTIKGVAKDKENNILSGVNINFNDENGTLIASVTTDKNGSYTFNGDENKNYKLSGKKEKYFDALNSINTSVKEDAITSDLILEKDPGLQLYAMITEDKTGAPLDGVKLTLVDKVTGKSDIIITTSVGDHRWLLTDKKLNDNMNYDFILEKEGYLKKTVNYSKLIDKPGIYNVHEAVNLKMGKLETGIDLAKIIDMKPIYFDLGKFKIRTDAAIELDKIVKIMNDYPNMVVELGSHTDCRASAAENMKLSDKRAKASAAYIKAKITNPDRITGKGYGESVLLNNCGCEGKVKSTCPEEEHAKNRRTEFKVIKL